MSGFRLTTLTGGNAVLGAAALPLPARPAQAFQSLGIIDGQPGTQRIPAPRPDVPQAYNRALHRSSDAPAEWYPAIYYECRGPDGLEHAPVSVLSDNQMPLPAIDPRGKPGVQMGRPRIGGQFSLNQPKPVPRFPSMIRGG